MKKTLARLFSKVLGSKINTDKQQFVFRLENSDGEPEIVSMPISESLALVEMIAAQYGATFPARVEMPALTVKWFELGRDQDKNLVLVLTLSSGGKLTFSIPRGLGSPMHEVLMTNASLSPSCEPQPDVRRHSHLPQNPDGVAVLA